MSNQIAPEAWLLAAQQAQYQSNILYPYVYPPIWAVWLAPITNVLSLPEFTRLVYLVHFTLIYLTAFLSWRLAGRPGYFVLWALIVVLTLLSTAPGLAAIVQNQPQILVTFLLVLGFERLESGHSVKAGIVLALAATIKIVPVLLIILFVFRRDSRGFWAMAITGLLVVAASFLSAGLALHLVYIDYLVEMQGTVFVSHWNWSFSSSAYQIFASVFSYPLGSVKTGFAADFPKWISTLATGLLVVGVVYWFTRLRNVPPNFRPILYAIIIIWIGFFGPMGWPYYYLPVLFLWPSVILFHSSFRWRILTFVGFIGVFQVEFIVLLRDTGTTYNWGQLYGAVSVLAVLAFLVFMQRHAFQKPNPV